MPPTNDEEVENEEQTEPSLRETLEAAAEEVEADESEESSSEEESSPTGTGGEDGDDATSSQSDSPSDEDPASSVGKGIGDGEGEPTPSQVNAPIGYSLEAKESWKDVPEAVKADIQKREQEIADAVANTGQYRRTHESLTNLANRYQTILDAEGAKSPIDAVEGLFQTVAELRVGSPQQRAARMAGLISHYGVDIQLLDAALSGEATDPETAKFEQLLDSRLAPILDSLGQATTHVEEQNNAAQQAVNAELAEFAKQAEFLNEVREDMADLIELASRRGRTMSFQDAYDVACSNHPTISKILNERAQKEALLGDAAKVTEKQAASASIPSNSGRPAETVPGKRSLREELEFNLNEQLTQ